MSEILILILIQQTLNKEKINMHNYALSRSSLVQTSGVMRDMVGMS